DEAAVPVAVGAVSLGGEGKVETMRAGACDDGVAGDGELAVAGHILSQQRRHRLVCGDDSGALEAGRQGWIVFLEEGPAAAGVHVRAGGGRTGVFAGQPALLVKVADIDVGVTLADVLDTDPGVFGAEGVAAG